MKTSETLTPKQLHKVVEHATDMYDLLTEFDQLMNSSYPYAPDYKKLQNWRSKAVAITNQINNPTEVKRYKIEYRKTEHSKIEEIFFIDQYPQDEEILDTLEIECNGKPFSWRRV